MRTKEFFFEEAKHCEVLRVHAKDEAEALAVLQNYSVQNPTPIRVRTLTKRGMPQSEEKTDA